MTNWVVIPIKALNECKTRLRPALGEAQRRALVRRMLANVLDAAHAARSVDRIALLGPERYGAPKQVELIEDTGSDLNAALHFAVATLAPRASRLTIVHADLPHVTAADIDALATADLAIAPDRADSGTNALALPLPKALDFRFRFGPGSFERHRAEAESLALPLDIVRSATLSLDIDTPSDLDALKAFSM